MAHCRSCGEPIVWAVNDRSGKRMPFNPDTAPGGHWVLMTVNGERTAVYDGLRINGYVSHHATCPDADKWRRRRNVAGE